MQVVCSSHRGSRDIEHIGSAHDAAEREVLKAVARECAAASQGPRPSDLCLAMAKRDSLLRAVPGWTARQARASKPRRWRAWWLLLHRGRDPVRDRRAARSERKRRRPWLAVGRGQSASTSTSTAISVMGFSAFQRCFLPSPRSRASPGYRRTDRRKHGRTSARATATDVAGSRQRRPCTHAGESHRGTRRSPWARASSACRSHDACHRTCRH